MMLLKTRMCMVQVRDGFFCCKLFPTGLCVAKHLAMCVICGIDQTWDIVND